MRAVGLMIPVRITDARSVYGRDQLLVQPAVGIGSTWVVLPKPPSRKTGKLVLCDDWPPEVAKQLKYAKDLVDETEGE